MPSHRSRYLSRARTTKARPSRSFILSHFTQSRRVKPARLSPTKAGDLNTDLARPLVLGIAVSGNEIGALEAKRVRAVGARGGCSTAGEMFGAVLRSGQKPEVSNADT